MNLQVFITRYRVLAAISICAALAVVACEDINQPPTPAIDEWAEQAAVSVTMRSKLTWFHPGGDRETRTLNVPLKSRVFRAFPALESDEGHKSHGTGARTEVRHFRDKAGRVRSIGLYFDRPGMPPKFVFAFEDGRIQSMVSAKYQRIGVGLVRTNSRVTLFDSSGTPTGQIDLGPDGIAQSLPTFRHTETVVRTDARWSWAAAGLRDITSVVLPRDLLAQDTFGCLQEYLNYGGTSMVLAVANTALGFSVAGCPISGITCLTIEVAAAGVVVAIAAWYAALDKLVECTSKKAAAGSPDNIGGGGSGGDQDWPGGAGGGGLTSTINQFIRKAVDSGEYWCSGDGSYCVYYS